MQMNGAKRTEKKERKREKEREREKVGIPGVSVVAEQDKRGRRRR